jgi:hypothetical protein
VLDTQKGEYLLVDAGELAEVIRKRDMNSALDFLFRDLVASPERASKPTAHEMEIACADVFKRAGLEAAPSSREVNCPIYGVKKRVRFHYGLGSNGSDITALFHRVNVANDVSVHSTALMVHCVTDAAMLQRNRCGIFYQGSAVDSSTRSDNLKLLNQVGQAIDIDDPKAATSAVSSML